MYFFIRTSCLLLLAASHMCMTEYLGMSNFKRCATFEIWLSLSRIMPYWALEI